MANLRRPIPSLLNGVSQQAPSVRLPSQAESQVNGLSSLVDGLSKRPGCDFLAKLSAGSYGSCYMSVMDWSETEKFIMVIVAGDLYVFDTDGTAKTVNFPAGKAYLGGASSTAISTVTVEDVTYIANDLATVVLTAATAGGTYKGKKQDFGSLPGAPTNGDVWLIVGDKEVKAEGYYMKWDSTAAVWEECVNPGESTTFNAALMPHKLTYNSGTGQFTFDVETWDIKVAGDVVLAPDPSIINREINDIFFYRNRLGMLAGEYLLLSEVGPNYTNLWRTTTSTILDSDPIDLRAANIRVSTLNSALPFNRQLAIQSDSSQFILSTALGQPLTPATATLDLATSYAANADAKPVTSGNSLFFPSEDDAYASIREYAVSGDSDIVNVASELTEHIPKYIPAGVFKMTLAPDEDMMFMLTSGDTNSIYVYKYFYQDGALTQNSWSYWEMDANTEILNIHVLDSDLYAVVARTDGTHLLKFHLAFDPSETDLTFPCMLDMREEVTGVYDSVADETTWTTTYVNTGLNLQIIQGSSFTSAKGARVSSVTEDTTTTLVAPGDFSAGDCWIGVPYTFLYQFSEQFVRPSSDNSQGSPTLQGNLHLRNFAVRFNNTGYIKANVTPRPGASQYSYIYGGKTIGGVSLVIGEPNIDTGTFEFPIVANAKNVIIELENDTHVPCRLVSAEWNGNFTSKRGS